MTRLKLLTILAGLALLTACGGGTPETKTDDTGATDPCMANPYGATCGTEFETQRLSIVSECTDDNTGDLCTEATTFACTDNFFHELCNDIMEYEAKRTEFNNTCTNTKSQTVCDMEALVRNCAANPFMDTCVADMGAIALRESRCLADTTINPACTGTTGIATLFCEANPFDTATPCMHGDYADERQSMCLANIMIDDSCRGEMGIATVFCEADPFNTATACVADAYNDERLAMCVGDITTPRCMQIVTPVCEANNGFNNPVCRGIEKYDEQLRCAGIPACADGVITTADWLEGFDAPLNTAGDYTHTETHQFLQGTPNGLDTGNISNAVIPTNIKALNLESFGGEAKNGVGWFNSLSGAGGDAIPVRLYSGIFLGTDLGAPLASADVSADVPWAGKIGLDFYISASGLTANPAPNNNFNLTVDFANSKIRAFFNRGGEVHFLLNAEFDDRGRFEGTIIYGTFAGNDKDATPTNVTNGVLTGLIGELGAVGVFISDATQAVSTDTDIAFAGGFVAISQKEATRVEQARIKKAQELLESQVTYTDWIGGFGVSPPPATPTSPATNQFLANPATAPTTLTNTIGGVGFFTENGAYYAGLLSNTNVGLPVAITPQASGADAMATWPGKIRAIGVFDGNTDTTTQLDLNVVVNLTARTFTATRRDPNANSADIIINGLFPAINNGVVTGTVTQGHGLSEYGGQLTGIIGQSGVVGAFYSDSTVPANNRYVGGFYAAPQ